MVFLNNIDDAVLVDICYDANYLETTSLEKLNKKYNEEIDKNAKLDMKCEMLNNEYNELKIKYEMLNNDYNNKINEYDEKIKKFIELINTFSDALKLFK